MSDSLTDEQRQEIIDAIYAGRKLDAIKLYRNAAGADLKGSKDFVESLEAALRADNPQAFSSSSAAGCGTAILLMVSIPTALYWLS